MGIRGRIGDGLYTAAHALRLDYPGFNKRVAGSARRWRKPAQPRFIELIAPGPPKLDDCVIEFEAEWMPWNYRERLAPAASGIDSG